MATPRRKASDSEHPFGPGSGLAVWVVLGVCRLHYTLTTGAITSKDAAGRYGLTVFAPRWHRVLNESLRIRRRDRARGDVASAAAELIDDMRIRRRGDAGSLYRTPIRRRHDALAFAEMVMADAERRAGTVFS